MAIDYNDLVNTFMKPMDDRETERKKAILALTEKGYDLSGLPKNMTNILGIDVSGLSIPKNKLETQKTQAEIDKLQKETGIIGQPTEAQTELALYRRDALAQNNQLRVDALKSSEEQKAADRATRLQIAQMGQAVSQANAASKPTDIDKAVLKLQQNGYRNGELVSEEERAMLPKSAFITIGKGGNAVEMLKPAKKNLPSADAAKMSALALVNNDYAGIVNDLESGKRDMNSLRISSMGSIPAALIGKQTDAAKIQKGVEIVGRIFSGAAVPETEVARFRQMFGPTYTDSKESTLYKMKNIMAMAEMTQNMLNYGMTPMEIKEYVKQQNDKAAQEGMSESVQPSKATGQNINNAPVDASYSYVNGKVVRH